MKINIYYGGRGVLDDPTLYVLDKMAAVLTELNAETARYNIYENRYRISTLPETLNDADGIILATTVEWLGIGGFMTEFLDACWLYGDRDRIRNIYMQPVVMSTTTGEREGMLTLENAWETLGGPLAAGLCGYVPSPSEFEENRDYGKIIEKKTEGLYRAVSQKTRDLPTSNQAVTKSVQRSQRMQLTPQESEQLSRYVADDTYVKKQKEDIIELSSMYRNMLGGEETDPGSLYTEAFQNAFTPKDGNSAAYVIEVTDEGRTLALFINGSEFSCRYLTPPEAASANGPESKYDVCIELTEKILDDITNGRETFMRAFSTGDMTARGDFPLIRTLDEYFPFG